MPRLRDSCRFTFENSYCAVDLHTLCNSHFDGSYGDEMFNRVVEGTKLGLTEHASVSFVDGYDMSNVDIIVLLIVQYIPR